MALSAQGSTFRFLGNVFAVTSVSVEAPTPEIVDMTPPTAPVGTRVLVPTGDASQTGRIEVEGFGFVDPLRLVTLVGMAEFQTPIGTIYRQVICDSASVTAQVGDVYRLRLSFTPTDYYP